MMRTALMKNEISSKLCSQEKEKISFAISMATNLLDGNNQQQEGEVFEDYLKELVSLFKNTICKISYLFVILIKDKIFCDANMSSCTW